MSVQFILGASGTGKTTYIYKELIGKSMDETHNPLFLVLPEQANLNAEKDMVRLHPMGGTMDISIVSFTRLAFKVFDELNVHTFDILDDYGKSMVIMKLLKRHQKEFTYYGSMVGKPGFVDEVKSLLSEFYQYQVTADLIEGIMGRLTREKSLYYKLSDFLILLNAFEGEMKDSYMVAEQVLALFSEVLDASGMLKNADIYFDGFTGFTPVQYQVLGALMKYGCNLYFSFTMDGDLFGKNDYSEYGLFFMGKQTVDRLCKLAGDCNVTVLPHVSLTSFYRVCNNRELKHLERQIFRFPILACEGIPENVSLISAEDATDEISFIAKMIQYYVREHGYHYRDFAVITGDLLEQSGNWNQVFGKSDIPYFLDVSEPLSKNPIAILTGMALDLFKTDFSYESVFSFLKTGYFDIDAQAVFALENYVLKYGVMGYSRWKNPFRGGVKGLHELNEARVAFMEIIAPLCDAFEKKSTRGEDYIRALYDFMSTNKIPEKIHEYSVEFEKAGEFRQAKAYDEVYSSFIDVLDKTMVLLGTEELLREHFADILMTGIGDVHLGLVPSTLDQVLVGDMERTRLSDIKILFFAGTNDGLLPVNVENNGLLADKDRQQLKEWNLILAHDSKEEILRQQFYLYLQLTKAEEAVYICYRESDKKGMPIRPSYFVNRVKGLFPGLNENTAKEVLKKKEIADLPVNESELTTMLAEKLMEKDITDSSVLHLLKEKNPDLLALLLDGYYYSNRVGKLNQTIIKKLYGTDMIHSVSRLETYVGCAYRFFLQYGLHIAKREIYTVESTNIGTILHAVMERFFKEITDGKTAIDDMESTAIDARVKELTIAAAQEENDTIFKSSYRMEHQLEVLVRIARRSIHHLLFHLKQGDMEPAYFEKYFSPADRLAYIHMALEDDMSMELKGIVDRVDIKETEDAVYVKVIDYKSGAKDIDYVKMYEGKQLQLVVYMNVMLELLKRQYPEKEIIPTGMYYYHIYDPVIEESDEERIRQKRLEENRLTGLVNQNEQSLWLMDQKTGLVIPVRYKKDGEPDSRNQSLVTAEELCEISDFVREKMIEIGKEIVHGQIDINPEKGEINSPCNVCDYKNICRFEPGTGGDYYRIGSGLSKGEAKQRILKKTEGNREENQEKGGDEM